MRLFLAMAVCIPTVFAQEAPKLNEAALRAAMEARLKDAPTARFRDVRFTAEDGGTTWTMCGYVNARNTFGGYAGFTRFIGAAIREGKKTQYVVLEIGGVADQVCSQKGL